MRLSITNEKSCGIITHSLHLSKDRLCIDDLEANIQSRDYANLMSDNTGLAFLTIFYGECDA